MTCPGLRPAGRSRGHDPPRSGLPGQPVSQRFHPGALPGPGGQRLPGQLDQLGCNGRVEHPLERPPGARGRGRPGRRGRSGAGRVAGTGRHARPDGGGRRAPSRTTTTAERLSRSSRAAMCSWTSSGDSRYTKWPHPARSQSCARHRFGDATRHGAGNEVVLAAEDERRDAEGCQLGDQVVSGRPPRLVVQSMLDRTARRTVSSVNWVRKRPTTSSRSSGERNAGRKWIR